MNEPTNNQTVTVPHEARQDYDRPGIFMSQNLEWVKIVYRGQQIGHFHRNFFLKLLDIPYSPKARKTADQN